MSSALADAHKDLRRTLGDLAADAGCALWLHGQNLGEPGLRFSYGADTPVVMASVYKVPLLMSLCRRADRGEIELSEQVTVTPQDHASGFTGFSLMRDPVTVSWRDLATSMIAVSDNTAADVILRQIGLEQVLADLADLGFTETRIVGGMRELHARLTDETGTNTVVEAFAALADPDRDPQISAYDAAYSSATTPAECTRMLAEIWADRAASAQSCAFIRDTMGTQVLHSRLVRGFPYPHVRVAGKTGSLGAIRNEIGVVEFPGEYPVAVALFTKSARSEASLPEVDRAIGLAARAVVAQLRSPAEKPQ